MTRKEAALRDLFEATVRTFNELRFQDPDTTWQVVNSVYHALRHATGSSAEGNRDHLRRLRTLLLDQVEAAERRAAENALVEVMARELAREQEAECADRASGECYCGRGCQPAGVGGSWHGEDAP